MNQNALTHHLVRRLHLFVIAALLAGLLLGLGVMPVTQAAPTTALQLPVPTYLYLLPDQATNVLPGDTSEQFTATVLSQYGLPMQGQVVSFSTDFGQFQNGLQYVEVQTDQYGLATVTISSSAVGTAQIQAWLDDGDDTYESGELTDDLSTKVWQEAGQPDFGDAPDPLVATPGQYPTLLANNGARHTIVAGVSLGLAVDGEADAQPPLDASGDDVNGLDDEDGVVLPLILVPGFPAAALVHGGLSGGLLDAWIDFNGNGVFDSTEHLFGGARHALTPGVNPPLSFNVPSDASPGTTYARFRLSSIPGAPLPPTGPAPDGEVEDYVVEIQESPEGTGTIVIQKTTDPPGATDFSFLDDFGIPFSLDDGVTLTIPYVPAGTYGITETLPIGWEIAGLGCVSDDPNDTSTWGGNAVTIDLDANETITCTFNNAQLGTIVLRKETHPPLDISFDFPNDLFGIGIPDLNIDGNMTLTIPYVPAGTYSVTEADPVPVGFQLLDVYCEDSDGGSFADLDTRTATIELDAGETVTCTFINGQYILTTDTDGEGTGTVTSEPAGILCGDDCTEYYAPDSDVTLAAHPGVKSYFIEWSRDCAGTERTTTVTMDDDKHCTAIFGYPVGGTAVPVDKLRLLVPWLGLAALASLAAVTVTLVRRRRST